MTLKQKTYQQGLLAEQIAALFLLCKGYKVLERRYKTPMGEIDLVVKKGKKIIFVEVKKRKKLDQALYSISPHQQYRIQKTALGFIKKNPHYQDFDLRFDVIYFSKRFWPHHLLNAWTS